MQISASFFSMSPSSILVVAALFLSACSPANKARVDELNEQSYAYHYRNLDSTKVLAERALKLSEDYPSGRAEAYNNLYSQDGLQGCQGMAEED